MLYRLLLTVVLQKQTIAYSVKLEIGQVSYSCCKGQHLYQSALLEIFLAKWSFSFFQSTSHHGGLTTGEHIGEVTGEHVNRATGENTGRVTGEHNALWSFIKYTRSCTIALKCLLKYSLSTKVDELFECVCPFCGVGA